MKNTTTGADSKTAKTPKAWLNTLDQHARSMRGYRPHELTYLPIKLDAGAARAANRLARRVAKRTGATLWQARAAIVATAWEMSASRL